MNLLIRAWDKAIIRFCLNIEPRVDKELVMVGKDEVARLSFR